MQEFHRQLFHSSADWLRREIKCITGVAVGEAAAEVEATTGGVVHAFTSGTMVQAFQLADRIPADAWNGNGRDDRVASNSNRAGRMSTSSNRGQFITVPATAKCGFAAHAAVAVRHDAGRTGNRPQPRHVAIDPLGLARPRSS